MRLAVIGCGHGTLDAIYASIEQAAEMKKWSHVDLVIIGGDFQAIRNSYDLNTMSVPKKYREIGDFYKYYSGAKTAPYLTIFAGGNHESSSYLQELYYGGWVAPNIYYLGAANVIRIGGLRIASMSGIWKGYSYNKPHSERLPYTADEVKSHYHVREMDVRKLLLIRNPIDIGLSHDWPRGIEWNGNYRDLFMYKDHLEPDARAGTLGSSAAKYVMDRLRPRFWFAAHLHCKFAAIKDYGSQRSTAPHQDDALPFAPAISNEAEIDLGLDESSNPPAQVKNSNEIDLDLDEDEDAPVDKPENGASLHGEQIVAPTETKTEVPGANGGNKTAVSEDIRAQLPASFFKTEQLQSTSPKKANVPPPKIVNEKVKFLALDKPLPKRDFLQLTEIDCEAASDQDPAAAPQMKYDSEWLAILRVFGQNDPHTAFPLNDGEERYSALVDREEQWITSHLVHQAQMAIPLNFQPTGPYYDGLDIRSVGDEQPLEYSNPQTKAFCELIGIPNWFDDNDDVRAERRQSKTMQIAAEAGANRGRSGPRGGGFRGGSRAGRGRGHRGRGR